MEFYAERILRRELGYRRFQFPTGWNYTRRGSDKLRADIVSIPNGMEFYDTDMQEQSDDEKGFNSQRDGILLHLFILLRNFGQSFNSQRDGILRY